MDTVSPFRPLKLYFIPFLSPGHMIPLTEMARLFAARGEHVTVITTPSNGTLLENSINKDLKAKPNMFLHLVPFPNKEVGLPEGLENFFSVKDLETAQKLHTGMTMLRKRMEEFINNNPPDCIISDMFHPWTADVCLRLGIPRIVFQSVCMLAQSLKEAARQPDSPHLKVKSDNEPFVFPDLPDPITMTRSMLPDYVRTPNGYTQLMEEFKEAEKKSYGILVNNFYELDSAYTEHYQKIMGHIICHIGPAALIHGNSDDKVDRGHKTIVGENECLKFLDSKKPSSVVYACFGSGCIFPDDQLMELACGLEASEQSFIWVVFEKDNEKEADKDKWLPKGFEERTKDRGMIIRGWAPQVLILDHPSIGGFLTHCGWNSVIEAVSAGVPMLTWPLYAEHFYNERLVIQVLGIGVEVGKTDWNLWVDAGKELIGREKIENGMRKLMDGGNLGVVKMRKKAKVLEEKGRSAVQEGGSSHKNLTILIEDLKKLRDQKVNEN